MKEFLKRMWIGFLLSFIGACNLALFAWVICIFMSIHTVETPWGAIIVFIVNIIMLAMTIAVNYVISIIPWNMKDKWKPKEYTDEETA
ncbi:MAG: hypothetical protein J6R47_04195 [Acholeplasmatales bacterium]|nr:hypothetical protein [Acholeplasmatales bacterium]